MKKHQIADRETKKAVAALVDKDLLGDIVQELVALDVLKNYKVGNKGKRSK